MKPKIQPAGLELQILNILWDKGPSTVREVRDRIADGKERAYTTVLSTMQVMERKKLIKRKGTVSGAIVYATAVQREQVSKPALRELVSSMFGGKPSAVMQHLLDERMVDASELAEIRRLLDEHASTNHNPAHDNNTEAH